MGLPLDPDSNPVTDQPEQNSDEGANQLLEGAFAAVGVSRPITCYGQFNFALYGSVSYTITLQAGSAKATITNGTLLAAGQNVVATGLPPGATVYPTATVQIAGLTTVTIGGLTTSQINTITAGAVTGVFVGPGITPTATVSLERTFDGGFTWITAGISGSGVPASYEFGSSAIDNPVSVVAGEPERQVGYRFNCSEFTGSVSVNYRISITGLAAQTWGIPGN